MLYKDAVNNEAKAKQLINLTEKNSDPLFKGYCGAGKMIMAKYYLNPMYKLRSFNEGKTMLELAIKNDSFNPELRYIRLTIQRNSPSFLGYNKKIEQDKSFLIHCIAKIKDEQLKLIIVKYLEAF